MFCFPVGMFASCVHVPVAGAHFQRSFNSAAALLPPPNTYMFVPSDVPPARYRCGGPVVPVTHGPGVPPLGLHDAVAVAVAVAVGVPGVPVEVAVGVPHAPPVVPMIWNSSSGPFVVGR